MDSTTSRPSRAASTPRITSDMGVLRLEHDDQLTSGNCADCAAAFESVIGIMYEDDDPIAIYRADIFEHFHRDPEPRVVLSIAVGDWTDGTQSRGPMLGDARSLGRGGPRPHGLQRPRRVDLARAGGGELAAHQCGGPGGPPSRRISPHGRSHRVSGPPAAPSIVSPGPGPRAVNAG